MNKQVLLAAIIAVTVWYLTRKDPVTGRSIADDLIAPSQPTSPGFSGGVVPMGGVVGGPSPSKATTIIGASTAAATAILPSVLGGSTVAAGAGGGAAAAGAGAGIGLAGTLAITGAIGGAAILAFGILHEGWFRGGEEGIKVNPARDAFFDAIIRSSSYATVPTYGKTPVPGAQSIQDVRYNAFLEMARKARVPEGEIDRILTAVYKATTMQGFEQAVNDVQDTFQRYESAAVIAGANY